MDIRNRIKLRREECGLTLDEVSETTHIPREILIRYESEGAAIANTVEINSLAEMLCTTCEYLMGYTDDPYDYDLDLDGRLSDIPSAWLREWRKEGLVAEEMFQRYQEVEHDAAYEASVQEALDKIKHIGENGEEYWRARELQPIFGYQQWRRFEEAINRAREACKNSGQIPERHFADVGKSSPMPNGGVRIIDDIKLSRYACYLTVMNGDPRKKVIAIGQSYFAVKTRQQELIENYDTLTEDQKRLAIREEMKAHNKSLAEAAQMAGVAEGREYAIFQNYGYKGLYGGRGAKEIHQRKGLGKNQKILDHMGSTELAANLFRATQTDEKLRREHVRGKQAAYNTHYDVGTKVRQTIKDLGGTMPEDLPTPEKSIKQIEQELEKKKLEK